MKRFVVLATMIVVTGAAYAQRPAQPNFLLVYADDLGWQDPKVYDNMETNVVGGFGGTNVFDTPYMDALATDGVLFREAYSPACVCAPSRAAMLSSQSPARLNFTTVSGGAICPQPASLGSRMMEAYHNRRLEVEETTLPELLSTNGYFNGHIGKWHLDGPGALDHDFHYSNGHRGVTSGMADRLTGFATTNAVDPYQLQDITGAASTNGFAFDQMTQNGLTFLSQAAATNQPFFCYFATWLVHAPWHQRTERLLEKYAERMGYPYPLTGAEVFAPGQNNPYYAAMVETFDYNLHQVLTYLRNTDDPRWSGHKLIENTYIFLTSDNGGMENGDPNGKVTDNYPLDEGKIHQEEGGTRVPFLAVGPGIASNLVSDVMINGLDLMPTILSLAGVPVPDGLDGLDLSALMLTDPTNAQLVTNAVGAVRDTMYWHFPHSGQNNATIRKGGWKLFYNFDHVNNGSLNEYRLYHLYDTNGVRVDIEEMVDLWNTETNMTATLGAELQAWLAEVGANVPHYNPQYTSGNLPNQGLVPAVTANGRDGSVVWVEYETSKAAMARVDLLYTYQGFNVNQQWFRKIGTITEPGRAEVSVPAGTTHYVFNLVDENNFMVSYPSVGTGNDGIPDSALALSFADPVYVNPDPQATFYFEDFSSGSLGNNLLRDSVGFHAAGSGAWMIDGGELVNTSTENNHVSEGAVGTIIDLSSLDDPTVSEFTLSFDYTMAEYTETLLVHVWGYVDHSSSPTTAIMNHGAQNGNVWEIASPTYMTSYNFGNPNGEFLGSNRGEAGDAAISLAGFSSPATYQQTFDLSGYTTAPKTLGAYDYLVLAFTRSIAGSAPGATIDNVTISVPVEAGTILYDDFGANSLLSSGVYRDAPWGASGTYWSWSSGHLVNSNLATSTRGVGRGVALAPLGLTTESVLELDLEYSIEDASTAVYVHLWGLKDVSSGPGTGIMNLGAQWGMWYTAGGAFLPYNMRDGSFIDYNVYADSTSAFQVPNGSGTGLSYSGTASMGHFGAGLSKVSDYDYMVIGIQKGTAAATLKLDDVHLRARGGAGTVLTVR